LSKEIRLRQGKVGSKQLPELIYRGEGDAQEGKRETLKELIVGASDVYFKVRAAKQKSSIMLGKLGCTKGKGVNSATLIFCSRAVKNR